MFQIPDLINIYMKMYRESSGKIHKLQPVAPYEEDTEFGGIFPFRSFCFHSMQLF